MHVLRQMVEKRLELRGSTALGFVDLEKAFNTVGLPQRDGDCDATVDGSTRNGS